MEPRAAGYVFGSAGTEDTARENERAFARLADRARGCSATSPAATSSLTLLGIDWPAPVGLAPIGVQTIVHPDGGAARAARGAAAVGLPMTVGTAASHTPRGRRRGARRDPADVPALLAQRPRARRELRRAAPRPPGYGAIVVTVDNAFPGWKPRDLQNAYLPFLARRGPRQLLRRPGLPRLARRAARGGPRRRDRPLHRGVRQPRPDLGRPRPPARRRPACRSCSRGSSTPTTPARRASAASTAIVVSNHGGRQIDGAIAAIDALPAIADAVGDELAVLLDSGIRSGADARQGPRARRRRGPDRPALPMGHGARGSRGRREGPAPPARRARPDDGAGGLHQSPRPARARDCWTRRPA